MATGAQLHKIHLPFAQLHASMPTGILFLPSGDEEFARGHEVRLVPASFSFATAPTYRLCCDVLLITPGPNASM